MQIFQPGYMAPSGFFGKDILFGNFWLQKSQISVILVKETQHFGNVGLEVKIGNYCLENLAFSQKVVFNSSHFEIVVGRWPTNLLLTVA